MSRMVRIDPVRSAFGAVLASVTLIGGGLAHSAAPAPATSTSTPAPTPVTITTTTSAPTAATVPNQPAPSAPPPLAPELAPVNPAGMPAMNASGPAASAAPADSIPSATAPGRMSPTAPMVQPATPPVGPAATPAPPSSSAATAAISSAGSLTQVALVLMLVVGLIAGAAWLLKRLGMARNPGGTTVRIVSGVSLSNRERILVVEVADQWIVVGVAPGCINTLATMPRQQAPAVNLGAGMTPPAGSNFALWLKQTMDKRSGTGTRNDQ